jgi:hypothetical protein
MTITTADADRMARHMMQIIREIQEAGELPTDITEFGQLHDHIDANVGWSDEIDDLPIEDWITVQARVDALLAASLQWKGIRNGFSAVAGTRTYYVSKFHDDIHVSYRDGDSMDLTHIKWGGLRSMADAQMIAQTDADSNN